MPVILREMTQFFPQFTLFDNRSKDFLLSNLIFLLAHRIQQPITKLRIQIFAIFLTNYIEQAFLKKKKYFVFLDFGNRRKEAGYYNFAGPAKYIVTVQFLPPPTFYKHLH